MRGVLRITLAGVALTRVALTEAVTGVALWWVLRIGRSGGRRRVGVWGWEGCLAHRGVWILMGILGVVWGVRGIETRGWVVVGVVGSKKLNKPRAAISRTPNNVTACFVESKLT